MFASTSRNTAHHFDAAVLGIQDAVAARNIQGVLDISGGAHVREILAIVAVGCAHCISAHSGHP